MAEFARGHTIVELLQPLIAVRHPVDQQVLLLLGKRQLDVHNLQPLAGVRLNMPKQVVQMCPNLHLDHPRILQRFIKPDVFYLETEVRILNHIAVDNHQVLLDQRLHLPKYEVHEKDRKSIRNGNDETNLMLMQGDPDCFDEYIILHASNNADQFIRGELFVEYPLVTFLGNHLRKLEGLHLFVTFLEVGRLRHVDLHVLNIDGTIVFENAVLLEHEVEGLALFGGFEHTNVIAIRINIVVRLLWYQQWILQGFLQFFILSVLLPFLLDDAVLKVAINPLTNDACLRVILHCHIQFVNKAEIRQLHDKSVTISAVELQFCWRVVLQVLDVEGWLLQVRELLLGKAVR